MTRPRVAIKAIEHVVLVAAALVLLTSLRRRVAGPADQRSLSPDERRAVLSSAYRPLVFSGNYPDTIALFLDYRCPYCAALYPDLVTPEAGYGVVIRHVAPGRNSVAAQAAVAAECARRQGRFHAYSYSLLSKRDSIGAFSWARFGEAAGLPNLQQLRTCVEKRATIAVIDDDLALARKLGISATPAAIHEGRLYLGPASVVEMVRSLGPPGR